MAIEGMAGTWLFTDNTNFAGGRTREQEAIVILQAHVTYRFTRVMWLPGDANYFRGSALTIGGNQNIDFQNNSRIGGTFSKSLARGHAFRASVSRGAYTTIGARFNFARRRLQLCVAPLRRTAVDAGVAGGLNQGRSDAFAPGRRSGNSRRCSQLLLQQRRPVQHDRNGGSVAVIDRGCFLVRTTRPASATHPMD